MRGFIRLLGACLTTVLAAGALSMGVAHADTLPSGELTCPQLFSKFHSDQNRLELQEQKADRTQQNIADLINLAANAQGSSARSFFQSQLNQQLSLLQSQEQNIAQGKVVLAQDQALLSQQGCNFA